jgi:hypothetical protein
MFDAAWFPSLLLVAASSIVCLAAIGIVALIVHRQVEDLRRRTETRLDELSLRLRLVEAEMRDGQKSSQSPRPATRVPLSPDRVAHHEPPHASPTLIAIPDLAEADRAIDPQVETDLSLRHADVWALAATGASPEDIARQTGQPIGQVELIVGLYRQVRSSRDPLDHARSE